MGSESEQLRQAAAWRRPGRCCWFSRLLDAASCIPARLVDGCRSGSRSGTACSGSPWREIASQHAVCCLLSAPECRSRGRGRGRWWGWGAGEVRVRVRARGGRHAQRGARIGRISSLFACLACHKRGFTRRRLLGPCRFGTFAVFRRACRRPNGGLGSTWQQLAPRRMASPVPQRPAGGADEARHRQARRRGACARESRLRGRPRGRAVGRGRRRARGCRSSVDRRRPRPSTPFLAGRAQPFSTPGHRAAQACESWILWGTGACRRGPPVLLALRATLARPQAHPSNPRAGGSIELSH